MSARKIYHVIADINGGWSVVKGGAERASRRFASQADAVECGRRISHAQKTEFVVHRDDGTVASWDSYGSDPHPSRDLN